MILSKPRSGFTLIELLVVVAVIGILASIATVSLNGSRAKARDAQRLAYVNQIQTALELYYQKNGIYPTAITAGQQLAANGVVYLDPVPSNPTPADGSCPTGNFTYAPYSVSTSYTLSFCLGAASGRFSAGTTICDGTSCQPCGTYSMSYGGVTYGTVVIGSQCWLNKHLNYGTMLATGAATGTNNGIAEKYCPLAHGGVAATALSESDCTTWGAVYTWYEAMNYQASECNGGKCQGICPTGWHIPTDAELGTLETYLADAGQTCSQSRSNAEDCSTAGTKLKTAGSSGFVFVLSGYRLGSGDWYYRGTYGDIMSSTQFNSDYEYRRRVTGSLATTNRYYQDKSGSIAVRCVRN